MTVRHFVRFNVASLAGVVLQLGTLWLLTACAGLPYQAATAIAVVATVAHNFVWHWRWTWSDRALTPGGAALAFGRFAVTNGAVSLLVNLTAMPLLVGMADLPTIPANLIAIASAGLANFYLADTVAFHQR